MEPRREGDLRPIGYLYKRVFVAPARFDLPHVVDIYSLSACLSEDFADYIQYWRHNPYWLFDSPSAIHALARERAIPLEGLKLFYYEAHELQYEADAGLWLRWQAEGSAENNVQRPKASTLEGFDVATFSSATSAECSPLSCNGLAAAAPVNSHCLFPTFESAVRALESRLFQNAEPGPYRIIAVHSVHDV